MIYHLCPISRLGLCRVYHRLGLTCLSTDFCYLAANVFCLLSEICCHDGGHEGFVRVYFCLFRGHLFYFLSLLEFLLV